MFSWKAVPSCTVGMIAGMALLHRQNKMPSEASAVINVSAVCTAAITAPEWPTNVWCGVPVFPFGPVADLRQGFDSNVSEGLDG